MRSIPLALLAMTATATPLKSADPNPNQQSAESDNNNNNTSYTTPIEHPIQQIMCSVMRSHSDSHGKITPEGIQIINEALENSPPIPNYVATDEEGKSSIEVDGVGYLVPESVVQMKGFERDADRVGDEGEGGMSGEEFARKYSLGEFRVEEWEEDA
ncbi:uncharacterized protein RCC_10079 [Ramularia collo-cygni]|uniref:Uncharacterized protein n=1 Tax=Ramularia collo-cygni TaxID=112498 RepID=A0A2D3VN98_9PEZI|nr:uncharacterized protein RCC_10079 [Ramularia collo-cygni]CZT24354.1 uncharacterized protein RCC_10079 [Ramularia collo-cygni]